MSHVKTIDAHSAGGAVRLLVEGLPPLTGRTLEQKRRVLERQIVWFRPGLLREPRGHAEVVAAVLTEPVSSSAVAGLLFFGVDRFIPICGTALIAATTIGLERRLLVPADRAGFVVDTLAGAIDVRTVVAAGTAQQGTTRLRVAYRTPATVVRPALPLVVEGRRVLVDVVWSAGWYAIVDREALGVPAESGSLDRVRWYARKLSDAMVGRAAEWSTPSPFVAARSGAATIEGVVLTGPAARADADLRCVTVYDDGTIDRSPSGGATAAVLAVLDGMGLVSDRAIRQEGLSGECFEARVIERQRAGDSNGVIAEISGEAWVTGEHTWYFSSDDPFTAGFSV